MIYTETTKKALKLMYEKHKDQTDKSGMPYVFHPLYVASLMNDETTTTVALLHDIVEDTDVTFEQLENMGFSNQVIEALKCLTHEDNVDYYEYVKKIGENPIATVVKMADLKHNSDLSRLDKITNYDLERVKKYARSLEYLTKVQAERNNIDNTKSEDNIRSKMNAGILGFAVGDALGVPVEFLERKYLYKYPLRDMIGYGSHNMPEGTWSDDTSLMIATMDSIVENGCIDYNDIMYKFLEWNNYSKYTATDVLFDIGISTSRAIYNYKNGVDAVNCGGNGIRDNGNGSLMRFLPVAYYLYVNKLSEDEEVQIINDVSSITHAHEISRLGCKIYCDYVKQLLDGKSKDDAYNYIRKHNYRKYYSKDSVNMYKRILSGDLTRLSIDKIRSSGFVVDSLEASLWCTLNSDSYENAVICAVNLGEDTDTIGAITGSLNGIIYGDGNIPLRWLEKLKKRDYLTELSDQFIGVIYNDNRSKKM